MTILYIVAALAVIYGALGHWLNGYGKNVYEQEARQAGGEPLR